MSEAGKMRAELLASPMVQDVAKRAAALAAFVPNGVITYTGGPPTKFPARFIRKTHDGKLAVTQNGSDVTYVNPDQWSEVKP